MAPCPNVLLVKKTSKRHFQTSLPNVTFKRRVQNATFKSQCLMNKYAPGRSILTDIHYNKCYNELNEFSYNKVYPILYEPSSKAIIDCLTPHLSVSLPILFRHSFLVPFPFTFLSPFNPLLPILPLIPFFSFLSQFHLSALSPFLTL